MRTHEPSFHSAEQLRTSAHLRHPFDSDLAIRKARLGCGSVARNRARRYLAKRRWPKGLWPLVAAMILIAIVFDRKAPSVLSGPLGRQRDNNECPRNDEPSDAPLTTPAETGAALHGQAALRCKPPAGLQAKHGAQVIAFLIRNRGKLDNDLVGEKWKHLDRMSLPLAVYLRDIEANDDWAALDGEISGCPISPDPANDSSDRPSSLRHRRILELIQEWRRRGEEMLILPDSGTVDSVMSDKPDPKDDDDGPPKP